ncbi:endopolygalacturonase [Microthyrium microscopicum]|uniref:endo-polygalacturonase n=1 Tax=Microthyrium microscopicum TaxID=703497 RepID=A0A6A6UU67_9PEZI|nr:endopolygalacturonase [Microthyrium microscopicum]
MVSGSLSKAAVLLAAISGVTAQGGCTVTSYSALKGAIASCTSITIGDLEVPRNEALDLSLKSGTTVTFTGKVNFAPTPKPGRTKQLVTITGSNIKIRGTTGHVINGNGQAYWDGVGGNSGKTIDKPKFFRLKLSNSEISNLHVKNVPVHVFSISGCSHLTLDGIRIDNSAGDAKTSGGKSLGHNTDAFDVGESNDITISNAWVHNQDDCLAINSGTNIKFLNGTCIGGHGLSIGSVGGRNNNVVKGVQIRNSKISKSENGVRIKTKAGEGKGSVSNVEYSNIVLDGITKRGIVIQQDYENGGPTGKPGPEIHISDLTLSGITGRVDGKAKAIYVLCASGGCSNWKWSGINISGGGSSCSGAPAGASAFCK